MKRSWADAWQCTHSDSAATTHRSSQLAGTATRATHMHGISTFRHYRLRVRCKLKPFFCTAARTMSLSLFDTESHVRAMANNLKCTS